jgi:VanZ family protein
VSCSSKKSAACGVRTDVQMRVRWWLVGVYVIFLAAVIFLADRKESQYLFRFIRRTPYGDKAGHFLLMGLFSLIVNLALRCKTVRCWNFNLLTGSLVVALLVTLEEFSQLFVKYRTFDLGDLLFDYAGIFIFGQLACFIARRKDLGKGARDKVK